LISQTKYSLHLIKRVTMGFVLVKLSYVRLDL